MGKTYKHMEDNAATGHRNVKDARKNKRERSWDMHPEQTLSIADTLAMMDLRPRGTPVRAVQRRRIVDFA